MDTDNAFNQSNTVCCQLAALSKSSDLTEAERATFQAAWRVAVDGSMSILRRLQAPKQEAA